MQKGMHHGRRSAGSGRPRTKAARAKGLYDTDINTQIKKSNENPLVLSLYENILKGREHKLLHRNMAMGDIQG